MTPHPQSNSGLYGYPYPEPIWEPPLIDVTGHMDGYALWIGNVRVHVFNTATNAARAATALRELMNGEDHARRLRR